MVFPPSGHMALGVGRLLFALLIALTAAEHSTTRAQQGGILENSVDVDPSRGAEPPVARQKAERRPPPSPPATLGMPRVVSWSPHLTLVDDFLGADECEYVKAQALATASFTDIDAQPMPGFHQLKIPKHIAARDPVLRSVQERVGAFSGIEPHELEMPLSVHKVTQQFRVHSGADLDGVQSDELRHNEDGADGERDDELFNVHHDMDIEWLTYSVIMYLSDIPEESGGETVFPCTGRTKDGRDVAPICTAAFQAGIRWAAPQTGLSTDVHESPYMLDRVVDDTRNATAQAEVDKLAEELWAAAAAACRNELPGAIRIRPKRGRAALFRSDMPGGGRGDPMAFHAGCYLSGAGEKWMLQQFKELPAEARERLGYG